MLCLGNVKPLQSNLTFFYLQLFDNKYNNNCSFNLNLQYCPRSLHQPRKLGWYLDLEQYFPVPTHKKVIIVLQQ